MLRLCNVLKCQCTTVRVHIEMNVTCISKVRSLVSANVILWNTLPTLPMLSGGQMACRGSRQISRRYVIHINCLQSLAAYVAGKLCDVKSPLKNCKSALDCSVVEMALPQRQDNVGLSVGVVAVIRHVIRSSYDAFNIYFPTEIVSSFLH